MDPIALAALFAASFVNAALPGPCIILTFGRAARGGLGAGLRVSVGVLCGDVVLVSLALLALMGLLTVSQQSLAAMKWTGVAMLVVLAARMARARPAGRGPVGDRRGIEAGDILSGAVLGFCSPFNLVFVLALLPQFLPAEGMDADDALLVGGGFLAGPVVAQAGAALLGAGTLRLAGSGARWIDYAGAAALFGFAGVAALAVVG